MTRRILRLQQIAEETHLPIATLRWYRHRGIGPRMFLLGGRVVAFEDDVLAWVEEQAAATATGGGTA
jgi:predicted DNA-binding transcriptional regulator AlpA